VSLQRMPEFLQMTSRIAVRHSIHHNIRRTLYAD
jgi:hypothetical protein